MSSPQQCLTCPQETKHSFPVETKRKEGCFLPAAQPCWWPAEPAQACPVAGPVPAVQEQQPLSCGAVCAHAHLPPWWGTPYAAPRKDRVGRMLSHQSLHLTPALPPLGGGESWAPLCAYSSVFPAAVRLASMYKLYLSLSVCRGQMLSKRAVVCRLYPSWVIIQNRFSNCAVFHLQVRN